MSVGDIIREFSSRETVPVDVNDVVSALRERGVRDEIYFFPADINSEVLRGQLVHWDPAEDYEYKNEWEYTSDKEGVPTKSVAVVYYASHLDDAWQRLVCCKEVLHILDKLEWRANTLDTVHRLTEKIVLPPELQDGLNGGIAAVGDRVAVLQAIAILFTYAARDLLLGLHKLEKISVSDIARMLDIPAQHVGVVLSDYWPGIHETLLSV